MRYISIFSGIEAASVAWEPLGWTPVAFCEVDEFPSAVLRERFPGVPNLGDITQVDWSTYRGAVDLVVGGSPCQSFSMAGKREGLAGASGLMWEYIRCVQEVMPEWLVWENVPGALSSERGWAFEQLLSSLDGIGYGLAWRVLDAQFFGVAQRRRRIFLVGHIGDMRASEVLFESESMCWGSPSSREKRQALARSAGRGAVPSRGDGCLNPLSAQPGMKQKTFVAEAVAYRTIPQPCPKCGSEAKVEIDDPQEPEAFWHYSCGCSDMGCENYVNVRRSFSSREDAIKDWNKQVFLNSYAIDYKQTPKVNDQLCHTLTHEGNGGIHSAVAFKYSAGAAAQTMPCYDDGSVNTLTADTHPPATAHAITQYGDDMAGMLRASAGSPTPVSGECMVAHPLPQSYVLKVRSGSDTYIKHDGKTGTAGKGALVGDDCAFTIAVTQDQTVLCMADDTANASVDVDVSGTLKVGGAVPLVTMESSNPTDKRSSVPSAQLTQSKQETSSLATGR